MMSFSPFNSYTSNQEYGRGVLMSMQQKSGSSGGWDPNARSINPNMSTYPGFAGMTQPYNYGQGQPQVHQPNCPNHGHGQSQMTGGGIFSTGGDSPTDFTVYVGDAATAAMAQNGGQGQEGHQDYKVDYYIPDQPNVSESGNGSHFAMNYQNQQNSGSGDQNQNQDQQQWYMPQNDGAEEGQGKFRMMPGNDCMPNQTQGMNMKSSLGPDKVGFKNTNPSLNKSMTNMTLNPSKPPIPKSIGNKYRNRQNITKAGSPSNASIPNQHVYSSLRNNSLSNPKPSFQLCGRCTKCKNLKDPNSGLRSIMNFNKVPGLSPEAVTKRFSNAALVTKPQATTSLSSLGGNKMVPASNSSNVNFSGGVGNNTSIPSP